MSQRKTAIAKAYSCKDDEVRPIALVYHKRLSADPAELAAFTAEDPAINAAWLTGFKTATDALTNVRPSKAIQKENSDLTKNIDAASKNCVEYGKRLSYWLPKAFPGEPGIIDSFGVVAANKLMRSGDTEGMLKAVQNIVNQITKHQAKLAATAWPPANLTDYQNLLSTVEDLNSSQETNKLHIPANTDQATKLRNSCYSYVQNLLQLNDIVHKKSDPQKHRSYQFATILKQIRPSAGGSKPGTPPPAPQA